MITLPFILDFLASHHLYLFRNITVRATLAALTAFALSLLLGPALIRHLQSRQIREKVGKKDSQRLTELHASKRDTPTQGGLLIVLVMLVSMLLWGSLLNGFVVLAFVVLVGSAAIGYLDDCVKQANPVKKGLSKSEKLALQFVLYGIVCAALWYVQGGRPASLSLPVLGDRILLGQIAYIAWGAFVLALASNAVNLTDGLDGLAAGCSVMTGLAFTAVVYVVGREDFPAYLLIPYVPGCGELAVVGAAMVGAALGFLWFNCYPAQGFMGDTGSLALGGIIGYLGFSARQEAVLLLLGAVFMVEVASVVLQVASFRMFGRRIFRIAPIHHHFEFGGWHEAKVTVRFWILAAMIAMAMILTLKLR
jgi:phospho-N-acetylmuramoyl-pentapeptide-transferase